MSLSQPKSTMDASTSQPLSLPQVSAAMRAKADATLQRAGVTPDVVGHRWAADLLCVTSKNRAALTEPEREALDKAASALGYSPVEVTVVSVPEIVAAVGDGSAVTQVLVAVVEALNPIALIYLDTRAHAYAPAVDRRVAAVDDFFDSLGDQQRKRLAWNQMQPARLEPVYR